MFSFMSGLAIGYQFYYWENFIFGLQNVSRWYHKLYMSVHEIKCIFAREM